MLLRDHCFFTSNKGGGKCFCPCLSVCLSNARENRPIANLKLKRWRQPAVIWCPCSSICIMDLPALRTTSFLHENGIAACRWVYVGSEMDLPPRTAWLAYGTLQALFTKHTTTTEAWNLVGRAQKAIFEHYLVQKGAWSGSRNPFLNFETHSYLWNR